MREIGLDPVPADSALAPLALEIANATRLAADADVVVAVGPGGSREVLQVAPIHREAGLMQIVPTATSRLLRTAGDFVFRLAPDDSIQGAFLGAFADTALRARRAAILYVPDEYGIGLMAGTASALEARGISLIDRAPLRLRRDCRNAATRARTRTSPHNSRCAAGPTSWSSPRERWRRPARTGRSARAGRPSASSSGTAPSWTRAPSPGQERRRRARTRRVLAPAAPRQRLGGDGARARTSAKGVPMRHGDAKFYDAVMLAATAIHEGGASRRGVRRYLLSLGRERPAFAGVTGADRRRTGRRARRSLLTRVRGAGTEIVR